MTAPDPNVSTPQDGHRADEGNDSNGELSPEALRAELKRARDEAAKYRQRAREFGDDETYQRAKDAVAALEKAEQDKKSEVEKLTEKSEGLMHRAASAEQELLRLRVALGAGVDTTQIDEFASRLRGDTEDDLKKDAEQLARFFQSTSTPARRGDPSQGHGNDAQPPADPIHAALIDKLGIAT
jgi:hypothetical protein